MGRGRQQERAMPALGQLQAARAAWLLGPLGCPPKKTYTPNQGQRVSLFGSGTEEHTRSCAWGRTQVSRKILYSFVSSDFDLTMGCDALSTRY